MAYIPRLSMGGIYGSPYYTTWNAYYPRYRMPNCTAYSFGRFNELAQVTAYNSRWPTGNGCDWFVQAPGKGLTVGQVPALGAAACWWYVDSHGDPSGHCSIVEQLNLDSGGNVVSFVTSNSAWYRTDPDDDWSSIGTVKNEYPYFYLRTVYMNDLDNVSGHPEAYFQGFVYHPDIHETPVTSTSDIITILSRLANSGKKSVKILRRRNI